MGAFCQVPYLKAAAWQGGRLPEAHLHTCIHTPAADSYLSAAAWRVDDYLNPEEGEEDDDLDLTSLRQHK